MARSLSAVDGDNRGQAFFPTPGGIGAGEWSFAQLYGLLGCDPSLGVLGSFILRMLGWGLGLSGYLFYLYGCRSEDRSTAIAGRRAVPDSAAQGPIPAAIRKRRAS